MTHRMIFNQTGYFGRGAIAHIAPEIARRSLTKAFIVTDPVLADNGTAARITDLLDEAGIDWEIFSDVVPNPPIEKVQAGLAAFRASGADVLIGLGGGSPQDTCKAISVIATNPDFEDVLSLEGLSPTTRPGVPIIGVPTTAGTASETTINYVITDSSKQRKFVCVDPHDIPVMAFNAEHTGEKYRDIAEAFGVEEARTMPLEEARAAAVEAVAQLTRDLGNPTRISEVGVEADGIEALADDAFADVCTPGNPRPTTREDIKALYTSLLCGRAKRPLERDAAQPPPGDRATWLEAVSALSGGCRGGR